MGFKVKVSDHTNVELIEEELQWKLLESRFDSWTISAISTHKNKSYQEIKHRAAKHG